MTRSRHSDHQFSLDFEHAAVSPPGAGTLNPLDSSPDTIDQLLDHWRQAGWIRPLDLAFARLIRQLAAEQGSAPTPLLVLLAALVSHQVGRGHVCLDLTTLLEDPAGTLALPPEDTDAGTDTVADLAQNRPADVLDPVTLEDCLDALDNSCAVSDGSPTTPLVRQGRRLYLRRFWRYEGIIAEGIRHRLARPTAVHDPDSQAAQTLAAALAILFGSGDTLDYQKTACALAARSRFAVITGGPGTGKTTTVVRLLAALQSVAGERPDRACRKFRIRLAAPTGKAAARLNESIGGAVGQLPLARLPGQVGPDDIPTRVTTLHRLLGSQPDTRAFRHHRDNPLPVDILVIDEASMVDVDLMASVFEALPDHAQLILLGDKDQLASVDAGAVLGELCQRAVAGHYRPETADWLHRMTGQRLPDTLISDRGRALDQAVAMLRVSHRFTADSGIGQLAEAVNSDQLDDALLRRCQQADFDDVLWLNGGDRPTDPESVLALVCRHSVTGSPGAFRHGGEGRVVNGAPLPPPVGYRHYLRLLADHSLNADSPREQWDDLARRVLDAFGAFQVLCALRRGPWGVEGLNRRIAQQLLAEGLIPRTEGWYPGRPVLITGNDYNLGLMNGDIGITFSVPWDPTDDGPPTPALRVAFPANDGTDGIRWISPSRLQQLETVYAMTVHKSQGSEFGHTCLVLPDRLSPVLTRELVYTGITRARHWFSLVTGDARVLRASVQQQVVRASGLADRLDDH